ncbi:MAG: ABC transporter ATP-binding protein [Phycisphaerales bacterium]
MIQVRSVSKSFGRVNAVSRVSFDVARGEVVGLLGANGAGKTTTIRMITGFLPPDTGSVAVEGFDTLRAGESARARVGYLPEAAPAYAEMSVEGYLDYRARLFSMKRGDRRGAVERSLTRCDLAAVRRRRVGQLSRGFRQRVGLAAAILHDPPALVLDEPTSALDPRQIREARALIRALAADKAVLVSSHILPEVEQTCDRVIIMAGGTVRVDAKPRDLIGSLREASPYVVEARGPADRVSKAAAAVAGVERTEVIGSAEGWTRIRLFGRSGQDLRAAIAAALTSEGMPIRELTREAPSLERVFLQLIESADGAPPPPAAAAGARPTGAAA